MAKVFGSIMTINYKELLKGITDPTLRRQMMSQMKEQENTNSFIDEVENVSFTTETIESIDNISDGYDTDTQEKTSVEQTQPQEETRTMILRMPYKVEDRVSKSGKRVFKGSFGKDNLFILAYLPFDKPIPHEFKLEIINEVGGW